MPPEEEVKTKEQNLNQPASAESSSEAKEQISSESVQPTSVQGYSVAKEVQVETTPAEQTSPEVVAATSGEGSAQIPVFEPRVESAQVQNAGNISVGLSQKDRWVRFLEKITGTRQKKLDKIIEFAKKHPPSQGSGVTRKGIRNDDVEKLLHVSDATASRYLAKLVKDGRLKSVGNSKTNTTYEIIN